VKRSLLSQKLTPEVLSRPNGFTLIEVLLAIALFAIIIVSLFSSYTGSLKVMKIAEPQADLYRKARVALARISDDLQSAYYIPGEDDTAGGEGTIHFVGTDEMIDVRDADTLRFTSRGHVSFGGEKAAVGLTNISYYLEEADDGLILYRADVPLYGPQPDKKTAGLVLCDGLAGINFSYFDEAGDRYDEWDLADGARGGKLPSRAAIQIRLNGESKDAPVLTFSTAVVIPIYRR